jgi:hypothetical protein
MKDPRESTIRKILFLLSEKCGDKTSLMARLKTTPWSRKKQTLVRHAPLTATFERVGRGIGLSRARERGTCGAKTTNAPDKVERGEMAPVNGMAKKVGNESTTCCCT